VLLVTEPVVRWTLTWWSIKKFDVAAFLLSYVAPFERCKAPCGGARGANNVTVAVPQFNFNRIKGAGRRESLASRDCIGCNGALDGFEERLGPMYTYICEDILEASQRRAVAIAYRGAWKSRGIERAGGGGVP
jgi:hypothetical protein